MYGCDFYVKSTTCKQDNWCIVYILSDAKFLWMSCPLQAGSGSAALSRTAGMSISGSSSQTIDLTLCQRSLMLASRLNTSLARWSHFDWSPFLLLQIQFTLDVSQSIMHPNFCDSECRFRFLAGHGQPWTFLFEWWHQTRHFLFLPRWRHCLEWRNTGQEWQKVQVSQIDTKKNYIATELILTCVRTFHDLLLCFP